MIAYVVVAHLASAVLALAPGVAGDVGPLDDALLAGDALGQLDLVVHHRLLLGVLGDLVLV